MNLKSIATKDTEKAFQSHQGAAVRCKKTNKALDVDFLIPPPNLLWHIVLPHVQVEERMNPKLRTLREHYSNSLYEHIYNCCILVYMSFTSITVETISSATQGCGLLS